MMDIGFLPNPAKKSVNYETRRCEQSHHCQQNLKKKKKKEKGEKSFNCYHLQVTILKQSDRCFLLWILALRYPKYFYPAAVPSGLLSLLVKSKFRPHYQFWRWDVPRVKVECNVSIMSEMRYFVGWNWENNRFCRFSSQRERELYN